MKVIGVIIFFCFIFFGCNNKTSNNFSWDKISSKIEFAENFKISKKENKTFLSIINPNNKTLDKTFVIDKTQPNYILINDKKYNSNSLISFSSTFIGLLDKINELSRIKGVDDINLIHSEKIKKRIHSKETIILGSTDIVSIKKILSANSQILLFSGFGNKFPNEEKLKKFNILCLPIYDWKETHPLGKAEWIKFFGVITNKEKEANLYFNKLKNRYFKLKNKYKKLTLSKPVLSGSVIGDFWYLPAGESYLANMFNDARINYVEKETKGTGSITRSFEYCLKNYRKSFLWINPGFKSIDLLKKQNQKYNLFNALEKNTFCYSHNPNLFWEKSAIEPDSLLLDMIQISHPELDLKRNLYFYKKLN